MSQTLTDHVNHWCQAHGWTDLFIERYEYWAFPPGGVIPTPVPLSVVEGFIQDRTQHVPLTYASILLMGALSLLLSLWCQSPLPLTGAFCLGAIAVALLDDWVTA